MNAPFKQGDLLASAPKSTALTVVPEPESTSENFDWNNDKSVIINEQPATAVYFNHNDQLVIRQRCWPEDDSFVVIDRAHLPHLTEMLQSEAQS